MRKFMYLMCFFLVVYDHFKSIEAASSRSPNDNNLVLITFGNKDKTYDSSDSNKISFPSTNKFHEIRETNGRSIERDENTEGNSSNDNNKFKVWSKTSKEDNSFKRNDRLIFEGDPTSRKVSISITNKEEVISSPSHAVSKTKTKNQSFRNQNTVDRHESDMFFKPEIADDKDYQQSFAESQISENRVPASTTTQRQRLCEKKYSEYIRIIFPEDEDTANDADEVDFDGRLLAAPGEYPHMTALGFKTDFEIYDYKCGGSLISEYFVISAAHCANVSGQAPSIARVGDLNLRIEENFVDPETRYIRRIYVHPNYNDQLYYHDIALIQLSSAITFSPDVRPIRLWTRTDAPFPVVFAMGYGSTGFGKALTRQLTYLNLTIVPNNECDTALPIMPEAPSGIIASQLCAFDYLMKRDTCQGDSGGPLQYTLKGRRQQTRKHYLLLGIISYGLFCRSNYPSVYTRISSYLDWIEEIVWN